MSNTIYIPPKYKVYHTIPWSSEKLIGKSYNQFMSLIGSRDWSCFLDGDAVHTSSFFGKRIEEVIDSNPQYSMFTCYTNRIGCKYQIPPNVDSKTNDQLYHRNFGENLWNLNKSLVEDITNLSPLSGVVILIRKTEWEQVGGFKEMGMLGVDNDIHYKFQKAGLKIGLMKGIYVQHWYRGGNVNDTNHLR